MENFEKLDDLSFDINDIYAGMTEDEKDERMIEVAEDIIKQLQRSMDSVKIQGTNISEDKLSKYNEIIMLCIMLFKDCKHAKIKINPPSSGMPFTYTSVDIDDKGFSISEKNKELFSKLIDLSDETNIQVSEIGYFTIMFCVNDIWTE